MRDWWAKNGFPVSLALVVVVAFGFMIFRIFNDSSNRTECQNLCLVQGYDYARAPGCTHTGDCICYDRMLVIPEEER